MTKRLVVATSNQGKAKELRALLHGIVAVETLADHPGIEMPPEDGETFEANAIAKAEYVAAIVKAPVLADDSGLVVDALDGQPGVRSARYADGSDADRIAKLLQNLEGIQDRRARFVCAMAFFVPGEAPVVVRGVCEGTIGTKARGSGGFGYDPVFLLPGGQTMAELSQEQKNLVSHRGRSLAEVLQVIRAAFLEE